METIPFTIEQVYNAPIANVWKAITDKNDMKQWHFELSDFKPEIGFEFQFTGGSETKRYFHLCKITEVVVGKRLTYSWKYDGYPGESFVTFELFDEGDKTRLKLTHKGIETFGGEGDFAKTSFAAGWTYITGTSLKEFVEKA